jgi:transposase
LIFDPRAEPELSESRGFRRGGRCDSSFLPDRGPAGMSKALSLDLRVRVLAAVQAGATHREAADRFGVSAASVSRWRTRERNQGDACPKALGGDRRSGRIEAHHEAVMAALGPDRDATIQEVRRDLAARGLTFGFGTIQRFFARHAITRKKRPRTLRSRIVQTSQSGD